MTRTDMLLQAAKQVLEEFRPLLDSTADITGVRMDFKVLPTGQVRSGQLEPRFDAVTVRPRRDVAAYVFEPTLVGEKNQ